MRPSVLSFLLTAVLFSTAATGQVVLEAVAPSDQIGAIQYKSLTRGASFEAAERLPLSLRSGAVVLSGSPRVELDLRCGSTRCLLTGMFRASVVPDAAGGCAVKPLTSEAGERTEGLEGTTWVSCRTERQTTVESRAVTLGTKATWFAVEIDHDLRPPREKFLAFDGEVWLLRKKQPEKEGAQPAVAHEDRVWRLVDGICRPLAGHTSLEVGDDLSQFEDTRISPADYRAAAATYARADLARASRRNSAATDETALAELEALYYEALRDPECSQGPTCPRAELGVRLFDLGLTDEAVAHLDPVGALDPARLEELGIDPDRLRSLLPERDRRDFDRRMQGGRKVAHPPEGRFIIDFNLGPERGFKARGQTVSKLSPGKGISPAIHGALEVSVHGRLLGEAPAAQKPANHAMIYDSTCECGCSGRDSDLGRTTEQPPLENILILSANNDPADPNDAAEGGVLSFVFSKPVTFEGLTIKDLEEGGVLRFHRHAKSTVSFREQELAPTADRDWRRIGGEEVGGGPRGSYQKFKPVPGVRRLDIEIRGSGAIDNLLFSLSDRGPRARRR